MQKTINFIIFLFTMTLSFGQYIDITGAPYYAIPNDSIDDSNAIQQAIDENSNRTIFFPSGDFNILNTIVINHLVEIIGENINTTIFRPSNYNGFQINVSGVTIKNMSIFGHQNDSNTYTGILGYGKKPMKGKVICQFID